MNKNTNFDIKKAREIKGWSQAELARKVGSSQSLIAQYEKKVLKKNQVRFYFKLLNTLGYKVSFVKMK